MNILKWVSNPKYRYLVKKKKRMRFVIWDTELSMFKAKELREEAREGYDNCKSRINMMQEKIKTERLKDAKDRIEEGEIARVEDDIVRMEKERDGHLEEMQRLDIEVSGEKPNVDNPEGKDGNMQTLNKLRELEELVRDYIKLI